MVGRDRVQRGGGRLQRTGASREPSGADAERLRRLPGVFDEVPQIGVLDLAAQRADPDRRRRAICASVFRSCAERRVVEANAGASCCSIVRIPDWRATVERLGDLIELDLVGVLRLRDRRVPEQPGGPRARVERDRVIGAERGAPQDRRAGVARRSGRSCRRSSSASRLGRPDPAVSVRDRADLHAVDPDRIVGDDVLDAGEVRPARSSCSCRTDDDSPPVNASTHSSVPPTSTRETDQRRRVAARALLATRGSSGTPPTVSATPSRCSIVAPGLKSHGAW